MDVQVKGQKAKKEKTKGSFVRPEDEDESEVKPSKVEAKRSKPSAFLVNQIKKLTKEQKETTILFMEQRNEARVRANMVPAYTQSDMDLYK